MQPTQLITRGTLAQLPHFDPVAQLCAGSNVLGWATTIKQPAPKKTHKAQQGTEQRVQILFDAMGIKTWSVADLREHVNTTNDVKFKRDTVRDYLHILVSRKMVVKSIHGQPHKFWVA